MTHLDVIRMVGNVLTEIDVTVGSLMPGDPDMVVLQDLRRLLDSRQLMLSRHVFDERFYRKGDLGGRAIRRVRASAIDRFVRHVRGLRHIDEASHRSPAAPLWRSAHRDHVIAPEAVSFLHGGCMRTPDSYAARGGASW